MLQTSDFVEADAETNDGVLSRFSPPHDHLYGLISADGGDDERPIRQVHTPPRHGYPVFRLAGRDLAKPLVVQFESDGQEVIVSSARVRVWGSGGNGYEALRDFARTLKAVIDAYEGTPDDQLTPRAIDYRNLLRSYFS